ncbi:nucleoid occlusion factor SlmA [Marinobacter daepoensis]|uniref:Nucleoid occlusion factor SlmA n=1 Tax=Marinobacter daepoensis TaxID=262077 RepID=A0ABS3BHW7_9GAMM|nr:nucleoid occlusion factor SlmA [Marinobacter daepoensis]MBN7770322.1 nucleoid occlusion factor SlmA [Marinobacter daepoensis]MBY6033852.1 nucleoid occlusion factor SlmA [Marinobacter daepoensis]MBY6079768.1 nucleoid occlusion factor SlmA [Marinobacter daepoensis]
MTNQKPSRRETILRALVELLQNDPGARITTAGLAKNVGVTEAALYRHFPSKRKMFEALIEFAEDAVFSRCQVILQEQEEVKVRLQQLSHLVLVFAERNPGLCCVLTGDALMGEDAALRKRASQFFERLETQIRQALKEGEIREGLRPRTTAARGSDFVMVFMEGRIQRFVRTSFARLPTSDFDEAWGLVSEAVWG